MKDEPPPNIPEDYKAWATITSGRTNFVVPCKIFLSKTVLERPKIYIFPNPEQFDVLPRLNGRCEFRAKIGDKPDIEILGEDVHISGGWMRTWEKGLEEAYLRIYPARLLVQALQVSSTFFSIRFRTTPSLHLSPQDLRTFEIDGTANVRAGRRLNFTLSDDFSLSFFYEYLWEHQGTNKSRTMYLRLIVCPPVKILPGLRPNPQVL